MITVVQATVGTIVFFNNGVDPEQLGRIERIEDPYIAIDVIHPIFSNHQRHVVLAEKKLRKVRIPTEQEILAFVDVILAWDIDHATAKLGEWGYVYLQ